MYFSVSSYPSIHVANENVLVGQDEITCSFKCAGNDNKSFEGSILSEHVLNLD